MPGYGNSLTLASMFPRPNRSVSLLYFLAVVVIVEVRRDAGKWNYPSGFSSCSSPKASFGSYYA